MKGFADLEATAALPGFEDTGVETAQAVLEESAKRCGEVLEPLSGDAGRNPRAWKAFATSE
jgi:hypothetical protein